MKVAGVVAALTKVAPPQFAESWDNVGLIVGSATGDVRKLLVCVDVTAEVLAEAARVKAQMILAHHPLLFKATQCVRPDSTPLVYEAVRRGVAVYCLHTNFDAAPGGTSDLLAEALKLKNVRPLRPGAGREQCKIVVFVPPEGLSQVTDAAFSAGAGRVGNYYDCAFFSHGIGAFCGEEATDPAVGRAGEHEVVEEIRLEVVCPRAKAAAVCAAVRAAHDYDEPVIDVYPLDDLPSGWGQGRVGELHRPATMPTLVARVKKALGLPKVLVAGRPGRAGGARRANLVSTVACAAGAGRSLVSDARAAGAGLYVTGELGHHDALDAAEAGLTVVALGHGNSERPAMRRLAEQLGKTLPKLKVAYAKSDCDPLEVV